MSSLDINNISGSNKTINTLGSQIIINLDKSIVFESNKKYEMALLNGSIVYAHPNVINRYLRFTYKNLTYNLQLENGIYDINALNIAFQNLTSYLYPTNGLFSIEPLTSTSQVCIFFYDYVNTELSFQSDNNDNIMDLLGFTPSDTTKFTPTSITNFAISQGKAMLNNISQFFVNIDCVNSSYNDAQASTTQVCIFFYDYVNTELSFQSDNNDNIMDLLGFTPSDTTNFTPLSITNFALSQGKAMLNNISQFLISAYCITSTYNNSQSSNLLYTSTIEVSLYSTQNLMPYNMVWSDI